MEARLRVLVIEDHRDIAANIGDYLSAHGHEVSFAHDGPTGLTLATSRDFDVLVLDVMLPGLDGHALCRALRVERDTPVLMLTARDTVQDKVDGFRTGADDYLTKPFSLEELDARLVALVRRSRPRSGSGAILKVGDLELDPGTRAVHRAGRPIDLNPASFTILTELMRASPQVVEKGRLEEALWGDAVRGTDTLRSQIYLLRQAIDRPFARPLLMTVHGVGYRLAAGDDR
jgi:DNA-binding response OmpR family regulator